MKQISAQKEYNENIKTIKGKSMNRKYRVFAWMVLILLTSCTQADSLPAPSSTSPPASPSPTISATKTQASDYSQLENTLKAYRTDYQAARSSMVADFIIPQGIDDPEVIRAMQTVPRHMFVPEALINEAYEDHPLPIGYGQTISQPFIVALMTQLLELEAGDKVLEIGTGSGYQAAVLAEIGTLNVYSIEIVPELAAQAEQNLSNAGYLNIHLKEVDGYYGWEEYAPFDAIIVTAAPDHVPAPLVAQLVEGGILVIPIGPPGWYQTLWKFTNSDGTLIAENMGLVGFVPFTGEGITSDEP
jgi:protein-L-isoaspartate(D-aspartate) O-methyltransferase